MRNEMTIVLKDGPLRQLSTPKYNRELAHLTLLREGSDKAREGFDPLKVQPRPGWVWGKIQNVFATSDAIIARPANMKAAVRHWITTPDGRKFIFEYARGELIRTMDGEWLMVSEKYILAEQIADRSILMRNHAVLLEVEPLPTQTGSLYDPSARQVQAEIGRVLACDTDLVLVNDRVAFVVTAGTYCIIDKKEYRVIDRDQILAVITP